MTKKNVCRLVVEGKLLGFKVGGSWRFKELDIENWIEEKRRRPRCRNCCRMLDFESVKQVTVGMNV